jgi:hypothetical protein
MGKMKVTGFFLLPVLLLASVVVGQNKPPVHVKPETPHLAFVQEYVRELISDEELKTSGQKELSEAKTTEEQISTGIYFSKSVQLELRSQIRMLNGMRLAKPFETLIPDLIGFYQHEVELHQSLIDIDSKFIAGPQSGVDYPALAAKMPQIRAELEETQKAVFDATPLIFIALIDQKPDSQNHLSHLLITRAEKSDLQDQLEIMLKDVPEKGDHDYYISAAMVLRGGLQKGYKCTDEP